MKRYLVWLGALLGCAHQQSFDRAQIAPGTSQGLAMSCQVEQDKSGEAFRYVSCRFQNQGEQVWTKPVARVEFHPDKHGTRVASRGTIYELHKSEGNGFLGTLLTAATLSFFAGADRSGEAGYVGAGVLAGRALPEYDKQAGSFGEAHLMSDTFRVNPGGEVEKFLVIEVLNERVLPEGINICFESGPCLGAVLGPYVRGSYRW